MHNLPRSSLAKMWDLGIITGVMLQHEARNTASDIAMAISDGFNCLHAMIKWIDASATAVDTLAIERATLATAMVALESAMIELLNGVKNGRIQGGLPIHESDIDDVRRLRAMIAESLSDGEISPEVGVLANQCMNTLAGGDWRRALKETAGS